MSKDFWIGIDQTLNTMVKLCDGYGKPDEMFSARAWRLRKEHPKLYVWIDRLFFWDKDHCKECYANTKVWTAGQNRVMARFWRSIFQ